jgi:putative ABC transport system permease protein
MIYYTFVSLQYNKEVVAMIENLNSLRSIFMMSSVILVIFAVVFILYSNSYFTRQRKKEIGLYSLVGIPKRKIGTLMFYENYILGSVALVIGIGIGILFSKFFSMILVGLLGTSDTIGFTFTWAPVLNTIIVFTIITMITSIKGYRLIYKFKLIELFRTDNENSTLPNTTWLSALCGIGSLVLFAVGYLMSDRELPGTNTELLTHMIVIMTSAVAGTYLLFRFLIQYLLILMRGHKKYSYRGINIVGISQLMYRIKGNINTFTIIALLSTLTICLFTSVFAQYITSNQLSKSLSPFSYSHLSKGAAYDKQIIDIIQNDTEHPLKVQYDIPVIELQQEYIGPANYDASLIRVIPEKVYNEVMTGLYQRPSSTINLKSSETMAIKPLLTDQTKDDYLGKNINFTISNKRYSLDFIGLAETRILTWTYPDFYIIVDDGVFDEMKSLVTPNIYKVYEVQNENSTKKTSDELRKLNSINESIFKGDKDNSQIFTYYEAYKANLEEASLVLFVVSFLGLVFLTATGSILYFKQLTDANESKQNYIILSKLGITRKEIRFSITKQNLFVFLLPLFVAFANCIIMLNFFTKFFSSLIGTDIITPILLSGLSFFILYLIYYGVTVTTYDKIVNT